MPIDNLLGYTFSESTMLCVTMPVGAVIMFLAIAAFWSLFVKPFGGEVRWW